MRFDRAVHTKAALLQDPDLAAMLAWQCAIFADSPLAQDVDVLALCKGFVAKHLAKRHESWAASSAAQDFNVLSLAGGSVATTLAKERRVWALSPAAQNPLVLKLNAGGVAAALSVHQPDWALSPAAQSTQVLCERIVTLLTQFQPDWLYTKAALDGWAFELIKKPFEHIAMNEKLEINGLNNAQSALYYLLDNGFYDLIPSEMSYRSSVKGQRTQSATYAADDIAAISTKVINDIFGTAEDKYDEMFHRAKWHLAYLALRSKPHIPGVQEFLSQNEAEIVKLINLPNLDQKATELCFFGGISEAMVSVILSIKNKSEAHTQLSNSCELNSPNSIAGSPPSGPTLY